MPSVLTLLLTVLGAVTTAVFVEHRYRGLGLRARLYGWAMGPALIVALPLLRILEGCWSATCRLGVGWAVLSLIGGWRESGLHGPILMLSLWTFLYLAVSVVCWLVYRLVASGK
jgi:hypothetical protein